MSLILNHVTHALNTKNHTLLIFCDLKKAFDTCNHSILLTKLEKLGITGMSLTWFKNYLCNRKQFVSLEKFESSLLSILTGVPQGSILGPLLFLIYINDLPLHTNLLSFLFADDTALANSSDSYDELFTFANTEFQKLCTYFRRNKLSLHPDKTKFIIISHNNTPTSPHHSLSINNNNTNENAACRITELSRILSTDEMPAIKYLGVYFDPSLNLQLVPFGTVRVICDIRGRHPRPVIPLGHRRQVFDAFHGMAHPGARATKRIMGQRVAWSCMNKDVTQWVKDCQTCSRAKVTRQPAAALQPIPVPRQRFSHIHVDISASIKFHRHHGKAATLTATYPPGRFGALDMHESQVRSFKEKPKGDGAMINGGFFVLSPKVLDYVQGDRTVWEQEPMQRLATDGQLMAFEHEGFWQPMDTLRDKLLLEELWASGRAPWKTWE